jgi:hypothetical protein
VELYKCSCAVGFSHSWRGEKRKRERRRRLLYHVNEMIHEDFFYLKTLSSSLGSNFSKTTENKTIKMTDIKIVKVDKCSPYTFSFKTSYC